MLRVHGYNLDVVQKPKIRVTVSPSERRRRGLGRWRRIIPDTECPEDALCSVQQVACQEIGGAEGAQGLTCCSGEVDFLSLRLFTPHLLLSSWIVPTVLAKWKHSLPG